MASFRPLSAVSSVEEAFGSHRITSDDPAGVVGPSLPLETSRIPPLWRHQLVTVAWCYQRTTNSALDLEWSAWARFRFDIGRIVMLRGAVSAVLACL